MPPSQPAAIIDALHEILLSAKKQGAADLHFVVGSPPMMHINEEFLPMASAAITTADFTMAIVQAVLPPEDAPLFEKNRELVRIYAFPDGLRTRYHLTQQKGVLSVAFHMMSDTVPLLTALHLPDQVGRFAVLSRGLVLIVGPYGSGRSSTAAALLQEINRTRDTSIVTVESPIEYVLASERSLIEQRQVGRDVPSYEAALKGLMESDAEVVMIDTLPEPPAIPLVLELSMTRLVFMVIESTDTAHAIEHIIAVVPPREAATVREALADALVGAVAQRSVIRKSGGRFIVTEVLIATDPVKSIVRDGKLGQLLNIIQTSRQEGMVSLDQALAENVRAGEVEEDEALRRAVDPVYLKGLLERKTK